MAANASDEVQIARKRNRSRSDEETAALVVRTLMSTVDGRRYMYLELQSTHIFSTTFTGDALISAFREGERNVGLKRLNAIQRLAPRDFMLMLTESAAVDLKETANGGRNTDDDSGDGASLN